MNVLGRPRRLVVDGTVGLRIILVDFVLRRDFDDIVFQTERLESCLRLVRHVLDKGEDENEVALGSALDLLATQKYLKPFQLSIMQAGQTPVFVMS
jgi:hypothetical protein